MGDIPGLQGETGDNAGGRWDDTALYAILDEDDLTAAR